MHPRAEYMRRWVNAHREQVGISHRQADAKRRQMPDRQAYMREYKRAWLSRNRQKVNEQHRQSSRRRYREVRTAALAHYGGKCACCGESRYEFLAIDHINGGGAKHRRTMQEGSIGAWLKNNSYPDGFRVLCHNCNLARSLYGECPHEREVGAVVG